MRPWTVLQGGTGASIPVASMGPRPCGRGRQMYMDGKEQAQTGFNGATALRPWTDVRQGDAAHRPLASMGPRPCGRGRMRRASGASARESSFNGATALRPWTGLRPRMGAASHFALQWGHGLAAVDGTTISQIAHDVITLQWGHGLAAVDGGTSKAAWKVSVMLQWGHGLAAVDGDGRALKVRKTSCFNGATALRPWTALPNARSSYTLNRFNGATALRPWTVFTYENKRG